MRRRKSKWIALGAVIVVCMSIMLISHAGMNGRNEVQMDKPAVSILPRAGEKPITLETEKLDKVGEQISKHIDGLGERVSRKQVMGWIDQEVFFKITWLKLAICFGLTVLIFIVERLFTHWLRLVLHKARMKWMPGRSRSVSLRPLSRPISLLVWVYGIYLALSPIYGHFEQGKGVNPVHTAMNKFTEVGGLLAIVWILYILFNLGDQYFNSSSTSPDDSTEGQLRGSLWSHCRKPFKFLFLLVLMRIPLPLLEKIPVLYFPIINTMSVSFIAAVAWLMISALSAGEKLLLNQYNIDREDNLSARTIQTQLRFTRRLLVSLVIVVALASMLMLSEKVRQLGTSILASAGILGIVVGLAAQRSIANLLVGLQIAVTQPIRIDDVVVIENEWGRIEEITSTYVAVKLWDLRRLIVPLTYFIEKPFQNWTRTSAAILGTVYIYTDYRADVDALRRELLRILQSSKIWDGKVWGLQVTNAKEQGLELRALMSARDASRAWDLRCEVREKLVLFLQTNFPSSLPRVRLELGATGHEADEGVKRGACPLESLS